MLRRLPTRRFAPRGIDKLRAGVQADRSQFWKDLSLPFYALAHAVRDL